MIETKKEMIEQMKVSAKICDKCGKRVEENDHGEWEEFFHWRNDGGYYSVWGDGSTVEVDLCQSCAYELLHTIARVSSD